MRSERIDQVAELRPRQRLLQPREVLLDLAFGGLAQFARE
jgi:hypothetical protein